MWYNAADLQTNPTDKGETTMPTRCEWCGTDPLYVAYHDEEWGIPTHDDQKLFEMLITAGDIIGWSWFVPPYRWQFSAFATKATTAIVLNGKRLREKSKADHEFGYELQKRLMPVIGQCLQMTKMRLG
jgi:hypothetical protein